MNTPSLLAFIFSGFPTMSRCGEGRVMGAPARCRSCVGAARQHVTTRPGARAATAIDGRRRRVERDHATDGRAGGGGGARESNGVPVVGRQKPVTQRAATTSGLIHGQEFFPFLFFPSPTTPGTTVHASGFGQLGRKNTATVLVPGTCARLVWCRSTSRTRAGAGAWSGVQLWTGVAGS